MSDRDPQTTNKSGTYDVIVGSDGQETEVYIIEDTATRMVVRVIETGQTFELSKAVQ